MIKHLALATFALALPLTSLALGCSSSSSGPGDTTGDDASTAHDTGTTTDSSTAHDGGATDSAAHDSATTTDTGTGDDSSAATCPADTTGFTGTTYAPVTATTGVCSAAEIAAFVAACGDQQTQTSCNDWFNLTGDAGPNTVCGTCIEGSSATASNGPVYFDVAGGIEPNYGACVQLTDATNGTACGTAIDNGIDCSATACGMCTDQTSYDSCIQTSDSASGGCASFGTAEQTACASDVGDAGAITKCQPGGGTAADPDYNYIINLVCGTPQ